MNFDEKIPCRCCGFSYSGNLFFFTNDDVMGRPCEIHINDIRIKGLYFVQLTNSWTIFNGFLRVLGHNGSVGRINVSGSGFKKVTSGLWGTLDEFIVTGHENGELAQWDLKVSSSSFNGMIHFCFQAMTCTRKEKPHLGQIMDLQTNKDLTFLISSSKDNTAKVCLR